MKILQQVRFETAQQAVTLAKLCALTIAPRPSLLNYVWGERIDKMHPSIRPYIIFY